MYPSGASTRQLLLPQERSSVRSGQDSSLRGNPKTRPARTPTTPTIPLAILTNVKKAHGRMITKQCYGEERPQTFGTLWTGLRELLQIQDQMRRPYRRRWLPALPPAEEAV